MPHTSYLKRDLAKPVSGYQQLLKHQEYRCYYCACRITRHGPKGMQAATLDHKTPVSRGGDGALHNLCWACGPCNGLKGSLTEDEFRLAIACSGSIESLRAYAMWATALNSEARGTRRADKRPEGSIALRHIDNHIVAAAVRMFKA